MESKIKYRAAVWNGNAGSKFEVVRWVAGGERENGNGKRG